MHHARRSLARRAGLGVAAAALLSLAAASAAVAVDKHVTMYDSQYLPAGPTRIEPGDTVTWVNDDDLPHDAAGSGWATPLLMQYDSASVTFENAGTYPYSCTIHPEMRGTVIVAAASSGGGGGGGTPPTDTVAPAAGDAAGISPVGLGLALSAVGASLLLVVRRTRPAD
jgi:plastocyanin